MNKEVEINIFHEMKNDLIVEGVAKLSLETGAITNIDYKEVQSAIPHKDKNYAFSYGLLNLNGKELEFTLEPQKNDTYKVPTNEFEEMKEKAINLLNSSKVKKKI